VKVFAPLALILASLGINVSLWALHLPNSSLPCLGFFMESFLEVDLDFALDAFRSAFIHLVHLSGMVFEHVTQNLFDQEDSTNNFLKLFIRCSYVVARHIPGSIMNVALHAARLLALAKHFSGN
jgi:hypothetical protein